MVGTYFIHLEVDQQLNKKRCRVDNKELIKVALFGRNWLILLLLSIAEKENYRGS